MVHVEGQTSAICPTIVGTRENDMGMGIGTPRINRVARFAVVDCITPFEIKVPCFHELLQSCLGEFTHELLMLSFGNKAHEVYIGGNHPRKTLHMIRFPCLTIGSNLAKVVT